MSYTAILLNAKLVTTADGYVRRVSLEFGYGSHRKHYPVVITPGMPREDVSAALRKAADEIDVADVGKQQL